MDGRHRLRGLAAVMGAAALAAAVVGCTNEKEKYLAEVVPQVAQMDQVTAEMEAIAAIAMEMAKVPEAEQRLAALDERLKKLTVAFSSLMAPNDFSYLHANLVKALASEATGISALKGFVGRTVNASLLNARLEELRKRAAALDGEIRDAKPGAPGLEKKKLDQLRAKDELEKLGKQSQALKNEMDGQMKYYMDNHRFYKGHLRVYREAVVKKEKAK